MQTSNERLAFSKRLKQSLAKTPEKIKTSAKLALHFNLRNPGKPITQQAAHKWLAGQSIPKGEHLEVLATWLEVKVEWLQHGDAARKVVPRAGQSAMQQQEHEGLLARTLTALLKLSPKSLREVESYVQTKIKQNSKAPKKH